MVINTKDQKWTRETDGKGNYPTTVHSRLFFEYTRPTPKCPLLIHLPEIPSPKYPHSQLSIIQTLSAQSHSTYENPPSLTLLYFSHRSIFPIRFKLLICMLKVCLPRETMSSMKARPFVLFRIYFKAQNSTWWEVMFNMLINVQIN